MSLCCCRRSQRSARRAQFDVLELIHRAFPFWLANGSQTAANMGFRRVPHEKQLTRKHSEPSMNDPGAKTMGEMSDKGIEFRFAPMSWRNSYWIVILIAISIGT